MYSPYGFPGFPSPPNPYGDLGQQLYQQQMMQQQQGVGASAGLINSLNQGGAMPQGAPGQQGSWFNQLGQGNGLSSIVGDAGMGMTIGGPWGAAIGAGVGALGDVGSWLGGLF